MYVLRSKESLVKANHIQTVRQELTALNCLWMCTLWAVNA